MLTKRSASTGTLLPLPVYFQLTPVSRGGRKIGPAPGILLALGYASSF